LTRPGPNNLAIAGSNCAPPPRKKELIKVAADRQGVNVTEFIMRSACEKAEQTRFVLGEKQWKAFLAALDRPVKEKPRLRRLFHEHHIARRRS
jgi:uncharacterized protein (DUF1778 family)